MSVKLFRNILNTIFCIGAAVGMYVYWKHSQQTGTYVILAAMVFKFIEACLRIMYKEDDANV
jgi:hypothetical protein